MENNEFILDIAALRDKARQHIEDGAMTTDIKGTE